MRRTLLLMLKDSHILENFFSMKLLSIYIGQLISITLDADVKLIHTLLLKRL